MLNDYDLIPTSTASISHEFKVNENFICKNINIKQFIAF